MQVGCLESSEGPWVVWALKGALLRLGRPRRQLDGMDQATKVQVSEHPTGMLAQAAAPILETGAPYRLH